MKKLVVLLMALLVASSAFAIVDPDADMMGLYFDMDADVVCVSDVGPYTPVEMYLVLTNPSFDAVYGYEAGFDVIGNGIVTAVVFDNPQALNVGSQTNQIVGFGAPSMTSPVTLLATITVIYSGAGEGTLFTLHGTEPSSLDPAFPVVLLDGGELMSYGLSAADGFVAQINGDCAIVATDNVSFDGIKSLYR